MIILPWLRATAFFMDDILLQETVSALQTHWGLQVPERLTEDAIIELLADKVVKILEQGPDVFFQLMYRVDISEKKLNAILQDDNVAHKIARLIYDRQLQKVKSRREHRARPEVDDPELEW